MGFLCAINCPLESPGTGESKYNSYESRSYNTLHLRLSSHPSVSILILFLTVLQAVLLQSVIQCVFAVVIYYLIIKRRGSMEAYLIGWGAIIPASVFIPFQLLEALELQNRVVNLSLSTVMTVIFFRCIEAMYGTSPPCVELSLSNYVGYYSAIVPFVWDPKTQSRQRISFAKLRSVFLEIMGAFTGVSLLLSFLRHHDYRPFPSYLPFDRYEWTWELFSFNHIANAYLHAWLIYLTLKTGFELSAFNENIKGYDTYRLFDQPFFKSRSPTEFWTQRWNLLIQPLLKVSQCPIANFVENLILAPYHQPVVSHPSSLCIICFLGWSISSSAKICQFRDGSLSDVSW
jgi:hypothetical protein